MKRYSLAVGVALILLVGILSTLTTPHQESPAQKNPVHLQHAQDFMQKLDDPTGSYLNACTQSCPEGDTTCDFMSIYTQFLQASITGSCDSLHSHMLVDGVALHAPSLCKGLYENACDALSEKEKTFCETLLSCKDCNENMQFIATVYNALLQDNVKPCESLVTLKERLYCEELISHSCQHSYEDYARTYQIIAGGEKSGCLFIRSHFLRELCLREDLASFETMRNDGTLSTTPSKVAVRGVTDA